jgi:hypothetical protein
MDTERLKIANEEGKGVKGCFGKILSLQTKVQRKDY